MFWREVLTILFFTHYLPQTIISGFALRQSGRYAHSDGYIRRLARESGFAVAGRQNVTIRTESKVGIEGAMFALARVN